MAENQVEQERKRARDLVADIRTEHGVVSTEERNSSHPNVLKGLDSVRRKWAESTKIIADDLYSKTTRFIYELIQNSEDNSYTKAVAKGHEPFIRFSLHPGKMTIDSNEDGFDDEDVVAMCRAGGSSKKEKKLQHGYIGEKGIGFKSVFKVAKKVHVQSEPFSFSFVYERGSPNDDNGLGMVTPIEEEFGCIPQEVQTRFTLALLSNAGFDKRLQDLKDIPDTLLLFLTKLRSLYINVFHPSGRMTEIVFSHHYDPVQFLSKIVKRTRVDGGKWSRTESLFHVVKRTIAGLPDDKARQGINEAPVVLAFPVDEVGSPDLRPQNVFAYLPLRDAGFQFLIHSDFVTQASREDVFHSKRNEALLEGVAKTFRDAVLHFCSLPVLRYQWMRYIPLDTVSDSFWRELKPQILELLVQEPVLRSHTRGVLYLPAQLCWVPKECRDKNNNPLLPDLEEEKYLADGYALEDRERLEALGCVTLRYNDFIDRVAADLNHPGSKMKAFDTDDDWHTRVADRLWRLFNSSKSEPAAVCERLRALPLIPLRRGEWASSSDILYFPGSGQQVIPTDLGKKLVSSKAIANRSRRRLFDALGVNEASPQEVIRWIRQRYEGRLETLTLGNSVMHLRYLFWNLPGEDHSVGCDVRILAPTAGQLAHPTDVYFGDSGHEFSAKTLFEGVDDIIPSFQAIFLPFEYLNSMTEQASSHGRSWRTFLGQVVGVRSIPKLTDTAGLSEEFRYIIRYRNDRLVGLLQRYWPVYEPQISEVCDEFKKFEVPTEYGGALAFQDTYIPLPRLRRLNDELRLKSMPFIRLPGAIRDQDEEKWIFLKRFGVQFTDDLNFYLIAIMELSTCNIDSVHLFEEPVFRAYQGIMKNNGTEEDRAKIHSIFETGNLVFLPSKGETKSGWKPLRSCVWNGPEWLESFPSLNTHGRYADVAHLFHNILQLRDADWTDCVEELKWMRNQRSNDVSKATEIYGHLSKEFETNPDRDQIRKDFDVYELVFVPVQNQWCRPAACIWAEEAVRIPRKKPIGAFYGTVEHLFTEILAVQKPDIPMLVEALVEMAHMKPPPVNQIKDCMVLTSDMCPNEMDLVRLRSTAFLPVVILGKEPILVKPNFDFSIVDRNEYGEAFDGKIALLQLSPTEVHNSSKLLLALGLQGQFMSKAVEEVTKVEDGIQNFLLSQELRRKAYALYRCAVHFNSRKVGKKNNALFRLLQKATVHTSNKISKSMRLIQGSSVYTVEGTRGNFHMDHSETQLNLYVPRNRQSRETCYLQDLPRGIFEFLALSDQTAENLLVKILRSTNLDIVDGFLESAGIVEVQGINRPTEGNIMEPRVRLDSVLDTDGIDAASHGSQRMPGTYQDTAPSESHGLAAVQLNIAHPLDQQDTLSIMPTVEEPLDDTVFSTLLYRIIQLGSNACLPPAGRVSFCFCNHRLEVTNSNCHDHHPEYPSIFTNRSLDRDRKVGAAGELFVFELLLAANLPDFWTDNWRSTIRKEVRVCGPYSDLQPWNGSETSDFVYHDARGELTRKLSLDGYFTDAETQVIGDPTYYIEVKTTTRGCEEPFFMSRAQYERMRRLALQPGTPAAQVYVLIRVFNLEQENIGLRVYVDPEKHRRDGTLQFGVDTWTVKQSPRSSGAGDRMVLGPECNSQ